MTNRTTKSALLMSALALLLCIAMLTGTTFAWFTDEVTSGRNTITAGNLDVELKFSKVVNGTPTAFENVAGNTKIFDSEALWEPGRVEVVYLEVSNLGSLALKYQLGVNVYDETPGTNVKGETFKLSDHLVFKVVNVEDPVEVYKPYATREAAIEAAGTVKGLKDYNGKTTALEAKTGVDYVALIVYMPETVGNEANYKTGTTAPSIELGINLFATQVESEFDSFGNNYDADAWNDGFKVYSTDDLQAALNNGKNVVLMNNMKGGAIEVKGKAEIDLNGNTLSATLIAPDADLTVKNGTINADDPKASAIEINSGKLTLDNVEVTTARHALRVDGDAEVVINGGKYVAKGYAGRTQHAINVSGTAKVTINGGTFIGPKGTPADSGSAVNVQKGSEVIINGGDFSGGKRKTLASGGTLTVRGGSFDQDPSAYVADGYKVVAIDGTYYVVADNVAGVVTKPDAMKKALSNAGAAGAGNTTIAFFGDIDMTGTDWTPIKVDGYNGADIVTIEGNGATITGLTAPLFAGGFAGGSGIVIKDLTIADSNIVSKNTLGSGAFIESVDSMAKIDLINCHLLNSTVTGGAGSRTGGLIGWTAGYSNVNDGPVKTYVTIEDCSVIDCTITCDGSVGGIYGHAGNNDWTYSTVKNCVVKNNVLNSTDDGGWRVGVVVGTANVGELTIEDITESGNKLTQTGKTAPAGQSNLYGRFVPDTTGKLVINGATVCDTAKKVSAALTANEKDIAIILAKDIDLPISSLGTITGGSGEYKLGGESTESIVIDLNGKKLNVTTTYWSALGAKNADATITIKNGSMTSSQPTGTWNSYDLTFANCNYVIENVIFDKAVALCSEGKSVTMKNVTINETHDYYALWISAKGQTVEIDGLTVNSLGRGIKIDEQYVGTPAKVTLNVSNATFNTEKKAAILVKSAAGADIALSNVNIAETSDPTNAVWVDEDAASYADLVTVTGGSVITEN